MIDNEIYEDFSLIRRRARFVFRLVAILFVVAAAAYWKIQILDHRKFWAMSERNRTREIVLPAPRAILTDRDGSVVLADNRASFKASFIRENCRDEAVSIGRISELLDLDPNVVRSRIDKFRSLPAFRPIVIKDGLTTEEVARVEVRRIDLPELIVETEPRRIYPFGVLASHTLGTLQEVTMDELRGAAKERRPGDMIGKSGFEGAYNERITGQDGKLIEIVDSLGRKQSELERIDPLPNPKIALTLDFDLQSKAEELLAGKEGAVVILDSATGEVLTLASFPNYDPNKFINRFTPEEWQSLVQNPDNPLLNRALQGLYSPGSVFKPVMALGALDAGLITPETVFFCGGAIEIYGALRHCAAEGGHGSLALRDAIRYSCNIYFYQLGRRMSIDTIARYAEAMGLGQKTGIDIDGEKDGLVPSTAWKLKTRKEEWYAGETISVAIGQGPLQTTPLQIASMTARLANRGRTVPPHLLRDRPVVPPDAPATTIPASMFESVIEGMWRSVNAEGSARSARVEGLEICGKTGSTQTISRETADRLAAGSRAKKTHSWFTGFAPRNNPRIVVTVLVEYGGMGGETAAPIAGQLLALYQKKHARPPATPGN
jgi:penicillin-binding protein 2